MKRSLRTILWQDLVTTSSSPWIRKDRCLFLFNDILLITTVSRRGAKVLAKLYFVEKFLGLNKHVHRRSREACRLCRVVCPRCWRCVGTSLCFSSFLSDYIFCFQIVDVPHPLRCRHLQGQRGGSEKAAQRIQVLHWRIPKDVYRCQWLLIHQTNAKKKCDKNLKVWMFSEVDSDLKVVQGMAEQVKDVKVALPKSCPALYIDNPNV